MSESLAKRIGREAATRDYVPVVAPADDYALGVPVEVPVVLITASYEGLPPNNSRRFLAWAESLPSDTLAGRPFAVSATVIGRKLGRRFRSASKPPLPGQGQFLSPNVERRPPGATC